MTNQYPSFEDDALVESDGSPEGHGAPEGAENASHAHHDESGRSASRTPRGKSGKPRAKVSSASGRAARRSRVERDGIIHLPRQAAARDKQPIESDRAQSELEAQGFTPDEAIRIVSLSDRLADSREAREAVAVLRRLRFTRWLVEHGMLDEFSA